MHITVITGDLAHIAVYTEALQSDELRLHWSCGGKPRFEEADRLQRAAKFEFESALAFAPDDPSVAAHYAQVAQSFQQRDGGIFSLCHDAPVKGEL